MPNQRIVGIVLVRDEDVFVEQVVRNIAAFCDEILLVDHRSADGTTATLSRLAEELPHARFHRIRRTHESHDLILRYVGTPTWLFGVDGDELYDPVGLRDFRGRLLSNEFDDFWLLKGIQLHCRRLDLDNEIAEGWLAPPARSTTMLYNFDVISSWEGRAIERFMGGTTTERRPVRADGTCWIRDEASWDSSSFRCLHVCFLRRTSRQQRGQVTRPSIPDRRSRSLRQKLAASVLGREPESWWKLNKYTQGAPTTVAVPGFVSTAQRARLARLDVNIWPAEARRTA
jgi:glycosyl transferase family 2